MVVGNFISLGHVESVVCAFFCFALARLGGRVCHCVFLDAIMRAVRVASCM